MQLVRRDITGKRKWLQIIAKGTLHIVIPKYFVSHINANWNYIPAEVAQHCLLHMYRQGHKLQIIQEARYYIDSHGLHIIFYILQLHPDIRKGHLEERHSGSNVSIFYGANKITRITCKTTTNWTFTFPVLFTLNFFFNIEFLYTLWSSDIEIFEHLQDLKKIGNRVHKPKKSRTYQLKKYCSLVFNRLISSWLMILHMQLEKKTAC